MKKKNIITIAGKPGSGKSTTGRLLAECLGYEHFSSGDLMRKLGEERGLDIDRTNTANKTDKTFDEAVDSTLRQMGDTHDRLIVDSRMAWHWMPYSFKVYLQLDLDAAARRIVSGSVDKSRHMSEAVGDDPLEYAKRLQLRLETEEQRYSTMYGVNPYDETNYDLVVSTADYSPGEVVHQIVNAYNEWLKKN